MKQLALYALLCSLPLAPAISQDLSGYWKGSLTMRGCFPENHIELQISVKGQQVIGDSYHFQDVNNYVKKKLKGNYDLNQKKFSLQEGLVTTYHIPNRCVICVKGFELVYSRNGNVETLSGYWKGNIQNTSVSCEGGQIVLTRVLESAFKEIPEIRVDTGMIRLDFYDNAQVDGDSITVRVNNKVVLANQRLTGSPVTTWLKVDAENNFYEVEMVALNLGSIPPNTAILIITAGVKRYQLYLSSSDTRTAMVRFVYDPEEVITAMLTH